MLLELNKIYSDRIGNEWKIVCDTKIHTQSILGVDPKQEKTQWFYSDGKYSSSTNKEHPYDLIKLIGDDFTPIKIPREFKFEAYIGECPTGIPQTIYPISAKLGIFCTGPYVDRSMIEETKYQKASKWEFTMKELLEDEDGV